MATSPLRMDDPYTFYDTLGTLPSVQEMEANRLAGQNAFTRSFQTAGANAEAGRAYMQELSARRRGDEAAAYAYQQARERLSPLRAVPTTQSFAEARKSGQYGDYLLGTAGNLAQSMVQPLVGGTLGSLVGGPVGAVAGAAAGSYGAIAPTEAIQYADDPKLAALSPERQQELIRASSALQTLPEALLPAYFTAGGRFPGMVRQLPRAANLVGESLGEAGTEALQDYISQKTMQQGDPTRPYSVESTKENALAGLIGGLGFGAITPSSHGVHKERTDGIPLPEAAPAKPNIFRRAAPAPVDLGATQAVPSEAGAPPSRAARAGQVAGAKARDLASSLVDRVAQGIGGFNDPSDAAATDLGPDSGDAGVRAAQTPDELRAALANRDAARTARAAVHARQLLEDPDVSEDVKTRIAGMQGDFANQSNQDFVNRHTVARAAARGVAQGAQAFVDAAKGIKDAFQGTVKQSKQDATASEVSPDFMVAVLKGLTPEAQSSPEVRAMAPQLGHALMTFASRTGDMDANDLRQLSKAQVGFDLFTDPDATATQLLKLAGENVRKGSLKEVLSTISGASEDLKQQGADSFISMLMTPQAKAVLTPSGLQNVARTVDNVVMGALPDTSPLVRGLDEVFGGAANTKLVLRNYERQDRDAVALGTEDVGAGAGDAAEYGTLTEQDAKELEASFKQPNPARPFFRALDRGGVNAAVRAARAQGDNTARRATLAEYVASREDTSPQVLMGQIRGDLERRYQSSRTRDTATVQAQIKELEAQPEGEERDAALARLKGLKTEDRKDLADLAKRRQLLDKYLGVDSDEYNRVKDRLNRNAAIRNAEEAVKSGAPLAKHPLAKAASELEAHPDAPLQAQLTKMDAARAANAEGALRHLATVMRQEEGTRASDTRMMKFRKVLDDHSDTRNSPAAKNWRDRGRKTAITVHLKDKPAMRLSAESMVYSSHEQGTPVQRFASSLAEVMARPDFESMDTPAPDTILLRRRGGKDLLWKDVSRQATPAKLTEKQRAAGARKREAVAAAQEERDIRDLATKKDLDAVVKKIRKDRGDDAVLPTALHWIKQLSARVEALLAKGQGSGTGPALKRENARLRVVRGLLKEELEAQVPTPEQHNERVGNVREDALRREEMKAGFGTQEPGNVTTKMLDAEERLEVLHERLDLLHENGIWGKKERDAPKGALTDSLADDIASQIAAGEQQLDKLLNMPPGTEFARARDLPTRNTSDLREDQKAQVTPKTYRGPFAMHEDEAKRLVAANKAYLRGGTVAIRNSADSKEVAGRTSDGRVLVNLGRIKDGELAAYLDANFKQALQKRNTTGAEVNEQLGNNTKRALVAKDLASGMTFDRALSELSPEPTVKQSFVGAKADPLGARLAGAALDKGAAADVIWHQLGWFRGPDGKLRKEVRPEMLKARLGDFVGQALSDPSARTTIGDLIKGIPELANYAKTKLANTPIAVGDATRMARIGFSAAFTPDGRGIEIWPEGTRLAELAAALGPGKFPAVRDQVPHNSDFAKYAANVAEAYRAALGWSREKTAEKTREAMVSTLMHEIQHAIQRHEGFENGGSPTLALVAKYGDLEAYKKAVAAGDEIRQDKLEQEALDNIPADTDLEAVGNELYKDIIGEAEAFDVQGRLGLSDAEAKMVKPALMDAKREFLKSIYGAVALHSIARRYSRMDTERAGPLTDEEKTTIQNETLKTRGPDVKVEFDKSVEELGGSGQSTTKADAKGNIISRLIQVAVNAADPVGTGRHESIHDFIRGLGENETTRNIHRDLEAGTSTPWVVKKLQDLLAKYPDAVAQLRDPEERIAYAYQFWANGALQLGPKTGTIMARLHKLFRDVFGIVSDGQRVNDLFEAFREGKFADPGVVDEVMFDLNKKNGNLLGNKIRIMAPPVAASMRKLWQTPVDRLKHFRKDSLDELADRMFSDRGKLGFVQKSAQQRFYWRNELSKVLEGTTAEERRKALEEGQSMLPPTTALGKKLAALHHRLFEYGSQAGVMTYDPENEDKKTTAWVPLREVKNYFYRRWDSDAIARDPSGFTNLLVEEGKMQPGAAREITDNLINNREKRPHNDVLGAAPYAEGTAARVFQFINQDNAAKFAKFQQKDLTAMATQYVDSMTHRAEFARAFDDDGGGIVAAMSRANLSAADAKEARTSIQALLGTLDPGHWSQSTKQLMTGVLTVQNLTLLPLAIFSQMMDPIVLASRSGKLKDALTAYGNQLKALVGKKIDGEELARMIGAVGDETVLDAMGASITTHSMSKFVHKANTQFFKWNGMQAWDRNMRITAAKAGVSYLTAHRNDKVALAEVGLTPEDVKLHKDGSLNTDAQAVKDALFKFVDQSVLRPTAATKAVWMSDPRFLLVAHLKQFTYTMQHVILKRASEEALHGNFKPWMTLTAAVPVMLAADMAKFALTGGMPPGWGGTQLFAHAVQRSGLMGLGDFGSQAWGSATRGKMPGEELLGPTFENAMVILRWLAGDNRTSASDVFRRTVPGYRLM